MTDTVERPPAPPTGGSGLDSYFKLTERGTSVGTEIRAGVTTFLVMAYIIFVNPSILSAVGLDPGALAAGTALVAGLLSILMGVVANYPIAMAAGLGINAAVAFGLVIGDGLTPAGAMGVIVLKGIIVAVLVLVGLGEAIMDAVPLSLKRAIGVGIGLFILFIGFTTGGLIGIPEGGAVPVEFIFPNRDNSSPLGTQEEVENTFQTLSKWVTLGDRVAESAALLLNKSIEDASARPHRAADGFAKIVN